MSFYGDIAGADSYHLARGNAAWAGIDSLKEAALMRGSDYVDQRYRWLTTCGRWQSMFTGERTAGRAQDREWPRTGAVDYSGNAIADNEVPVEVKNAVYEAALRELVSPGSLSPDFIPSGQKVRVKVDVIEVGYAAPVAGDNTTPNRPIIPAIDEILAPLTFRPGYGCGVSVLVV